MAEINSAEAVRQKLREFDERMNDAISAARALAVAKADAERLVGQIEQLAAKGEKERQSLSEIERAIRNSRNEWTSLNHELRQSIAESADVCQQLERDRASAIRSIEIKLSQAEERLLSASQVRFANQEKLLKQLDADTHTNAELAVKASAIASEQAGELQHLLLSLRTDLQDELGSEMLRLGKLLDGKFKALQEELDQGIHCASQTLEERATSDANAIQAQMIAFKDEVAGSMQEQHESMSRQITDFLNKQNALVQNLTQQIDGFQRAASVQSSALGEARSRTAELATALRRCQDTAANQFETNRSEFAAMRSAADQIRIGLQAEIQARKSQEETVQAIGRLLDETLKKLAKVPLLGKWLG